MNIKYFEIGTPGTSSHLKIKRLESLKEEKEHYLLLNKIVDYSSDPDIKYRYVYGKIMKDGKCFITSNSGRYYHISSDKKIKRPAVKSFIKWLLSRSKIYKGENENERRY